MQPPLDLMLDDSDELDLTVHRFVQNAEDASQVPSQKILADATRFVTSVTRETRWHAPSCHDPSQFSIQGPRFQYVQSPQARRITDELPLTHTSNHLKEWNDSIGLSGCEAWSLIELDEFDHSCLRRLLDSQPAAATPPPHVPLPDYAGRQPSEDRSKKKPSTDPFPPPPPSKRQRLDETSLRKFLPTPHFYPSILKSGDPSSPLQSARWPTKQGFSPIDPHTHATCEEYIKDPYTRLAWIIPIRGCLQWDAATSASVLSDVMGSDSSQEPSLAPCIEGSQQILWTRDALRQFWDVLKGLRDAKNLGPLSLSFHATPSVAASIGIMEQHSYFGSHKQTTPSRSDSSPPLASDAAASSHAGPIHSPLRMVDHFKVYHDAPFTKAVRSVLHGWSYRNADQKIRLLKGAKLVLVDERSRGLLLC